MWASARTPWILLLQAVDRAQWLVAFVCESLSVCFFGCPWTPGHKWPSFLSLSQESHIQLLLCAASLTTATPPALIFHTSALPGAQHGTARAHLALSTQTLVFWPYVPFSNTAISNLMNSLQFISLIFADEMLSSETFIPVWLTLLLFLQMNAKTSFPEEMPFSAPCYTTTNLTQGNSWWASNT